MSTQVCCPACGHVSKHTNHGLVFTDDDAEKVWMADYSAPPGASGSEVAGIVSVLMHELGREIFWCPCGLVWLDGVWLRKLVDGQAE